ncbi:hypothetical protein ACA910_013097 [Epithemia clementina (nom. ined.)]
MDRRIFCANYGCWRNDFRQCQEMWCPKCYSYQGSPKFPVAVHEVQSKRDGDDDRLVNDEWKKRSKDRSNDFMSARKGDHIFVPFECDKCIFEKLPGNEADDHKQSDVLLKACIGRVNLDAMWSRASSTVEKNVGLVKHMAKHGQTLGLTSMFEPPGPLPEFDHCGYQVAITMVLASMEGGNHSQHHLQWDTVRRFWSAYSNQVWAGR